MLRQSWSLFFLWNIFRAMVQVYLEEKFPQKLFAVLLILGKSKSTSSCGFYKGWDWGKDTWKSNSLSSFLCLDCNHQELDSAGTFWWTCCASTYLCCVGFSQHESQVYEARRHSKDQQDNEWMISDDTGYQFPVRLSALSWPLHLEETPSLRMWASVKYLSFLLPLHLDSLIFVVTNHH